MLSVGVDVHGVEHAQFSKLRTGSYVLELKSEFIYPVVAVHFASLEDVRRVVAEMVAEIHAVERLSDDHTIPVRYTHSGQNYPDEDAPQRLCTGACKRR